tara:strand:+ start:10330 stop:10533 length:204 start_codon:yes stop_codon:yes gene_type:complete
MTQRVKFIIKQDGTVTEGVEGCVGNECEALTKDIEEALGTVTNRIHNTEYYLKQTDVSNVTLHNTQD